VDCEEAWDLTYACVVEEDERGVFWVQVQLPTRRWWRGPYSDREQAYAAAIAADLVARRCWSGNRAQPASKLDFEGPTSDV
jgi:hypothetical protein